MSDNFIEQGGQRDPVAEARAQEGQQQIEEGERPDLAGDVPSWIRNVGAEAASMAVPIPGMRIRGAGRIGGRLLNQLTARNVAKNPQAQRLGLRRTTWGPQQERLHQADRVRRGLDPDYASQYRGLDSIKVRDRGVGANVRRRRTRYRNANRNNVARDPESAAQAAKQVENSGRQAAKNAPKWKKAVFAWLKEKPIRRGIKSAFGVGMAAEILGAWDWIVGLGEDETEVAATEMMDQLETDVESEEIQELIPDVEALFNDSASEMFQVESFEDLKNQEQRKAVREQVENFINVTSKIGRGVEEIPTDQFKSEQQKKIAAQAQQVAQKSNLAEPLSQVEEQATGGIQPDTPANQDPEQRAQQQGVQQTIGELINDPEQLNRELGTVRMEDALESGELFGGAAQGPNTGILIDNYPDSRQPWEKKGRGLERNVITDLERAYQETIFKLNKRELIDLQEDLFATGFFDSSTTIQDVTWGEVDPETSNAFTQFLSHANHFVDENGKKVYWRTILDDLVNASTSFEEIEENPYGDVTPSRVSLRDPDALARTLDNTFQNLAGTSPSPDTQRAFIAMMREQEKQTIRQEAEARARAQAGDDFDFVSQLNPQAQAQQFVREEHGEQVAAQQFAEHTETLDQMIRGR